MSDNWKKRTQLVHGGIRRSQYGEVSEAIFLTQGFVYDTAEAAEARFIETGPDEFIYARYGNPTVRMFENRMAQVIGYEDGFACASGMAAVNGALMALLKGGDRVVASRALFGSCLYVLEQVLARFGVEITLVDGTDNAAWDAAITEGTTLVFLEGISNPTLEVVDLRHVCERAHAVGALVVVDDAMATPVFAYSKQCGADLCVVSTTKHVDGQGRMLGGIICGSQELIRGPIETYVKHTGGAMNPFAAWTHLKSLDTLDLRVRAQAAGALQIAEWLETHPKVGKVRYPAAAEPPAARRRDDAVALGRDGHRLRREGRQGGLFPLLQRIGTLHHFQQLRRREVDRHPSRDDHAPATAAGSEGRAGHRAGSRAALGRARGRHRPDRGPGTGARPGLS
jgi:O-succinylhomoserine sulfhydrylase